MSPIDWFGIGYIVVSIIVIIVYLGVYFGWFWGGYSYEVYNSKNTNRKCCRFRVYVFSFNVNIIHIKAGIKSGQANIRVLQTLLFFTKSPLFPGKSPLLFLKAGTGHSSILGLF